MRSVHERQKIRGFLARLGRDSVWVIAVMMIRRLQDARSSMCVSLLSRLLHRPLQVSAGLVETSRMLALVVIVVRLFWNVSQQLLAKKACTPAVASCYDHSNVMPLAIRGWPSEV